MATAQQGAMRTYLRDAISIGDPVARRQVIQDESLNLITDFTKFNKEDIETLCLSVRKPGGTISNPNSTAPRAPATIPNLGFSIPAICKKRLVSAAYTARVYEMIGRTIDPTSMNRARLKKFDAHCVLMEEHKDPEKLPQVSKTFGIVKAMDLVPGHLREKLRVQKVALSYVIREPSTPPAILPQQNDNAHPDMTTAEKYGGRIMDELIDYALRTGAAYAEDNATMFHILKDMVAGTSFKSSLKSTCQRWKSSLSSPTTAQPWKLQVGQDY